MADCHITAILLKLLPFYWNRPKIALQTRERERPAKDKRWSYGEWLNIDLQGIVRELEKVKEGKRDLESARERELVRAR